MDQIKIGKFITECRKKKKITQLDLAEKLGVTDRAVSKWERGINLPDASLMLDLCEILNINVNELLSGEVIKGGDYMKKAEERLIDFKKQEESTNKLLLILEAVIGVTASISFIALILICSYAEMSTWLRVLGITTGCVIFGVGIYFALNIERKAGYYECGNCHHKYIPELLPFMFAPHVITTRKLRCPECGKKTWNKKVLTK